MVKMKNNIMELGVRVVELYVIGGYSVYIYVLFFDLGFEFLNNLRDSK